MKQWKDFENKWVVDYEFYSEEGNPPKPICYAAINIDTADIVKHWINSTDKIPLYTTDEKSLFIAYFASAEMSCHKALNYTVPPYILDLFAEFRCLTNGVKTPSGNSLIGACNYYNIPSSEVAYKDSMRDRILRGPPYTNKEQQEIMEYCFKDVEMTSKLFVLMQPDIELNYALLRGRYMSSVAEMEYNGIPIDTTRLKKLKDCWGIIKEEIIIRIDQNYDVFEGTTFKIDKFQKYLDTQGISWEYTPSGLPRTDNNYMHEMAKLHPQLKPLQELKYTLGQLKLNDLQIGRDGRNRCLLSPFRSKTGRNQPSTSKFIFGNATWLRHLIKPEENMAIAYIDYEQQELGIAAVLSQDKNLVEAYNSGDPYLAFAKAAGALPQDATKETHSEIRDIYKRCMLALNYGMSTKTFAESVNISLEEAKLMVKWHKRHYKKYWDWNSAFIDIGLLSGEVSTKYHWKYNTRNAKYRSLMNWPMQSTGAEMLRLAVNLCIDQGIKIIGPVHDALLLEDTIENIENTIKKARKCMEDASWYVLYNENAPEFFKNFRIRTEVKTIRYPDRYNDPRGIDMWVNIWDIVDHINPEEIKSRLQDKILQEANIINFFEPSKPETYKDLTRTRRGQKMMTPTNISEKLMIDRIKKITKITHMQLMHLVRLARDTDFDIESEIDWTYDSYEQAKQRILQKKTLKDIHTESLI